MNKYIMPSRHTVETFPRVFFKHNVQDCNGNMTDKNDKDAFNQVNKKQRHELFMPIIFVTIQIIYWCYIGMFSIFTHIHHKMSPSPSQYLISWKILIQWYHLKQIMVTTEIFLGLSQNVITLLLWNSHPTNHSHSWSSSRTSYMTDH